MYGTAEGMSRRRPNAPPPLVVVVAVANRKQKQASSLPRLPRCRATRPLRSRTGSRATFLPLLPFNCFWCRTARRRRLLQQLLYVVTACVRACVRPSSFRVRNRLAGRELWGFGFYRSLIGLGFGSARSMIDLITLYDSRLAGLARGKVEG